LPSERLGLVVLTNLNGTPLPTILEGYVYDRLLNLPPVDWNKRKHEAYAKMEAMAKEEESTPDPDRKPEAPLSHPLKDYSGLYRSAGYGDIVIRLDGDTLRARLTTIDCPLYRYNTDSFELFHKVRRAGWRATFHQDAEGRLESFSVAIAPDVKDIVFTRLTNP
jgi:hypothetical protein